MTPVVQQTLVIIYCGPVDQTVRDAVESFRAVNADAAMVLGSDQPAADWTWATELGAELRPVDRAEFDRYGPSFKLFKMAEWARTMSGDVLLTDHDVVFVGDPFRMFEGTGDVFLTTRHYRYTFPINAGVLGFRMNDGVRRFLRFATEQCRAPSVPTFREYVEHHGHSPKWMVDQDLFCVIHAHPDLSPEVSALTFADAGWRFNFCPDFDDCRPRTTMLELIRGVRDPDVHVVHLKGVGKRVANRAKVEGWRRSWARAMATRLGVMSDSVVSQICWRVARRRRKPAWMPTDFRPKGVQAATEAG